MICLNSSSDASLVKLTMLCATVEFIRGRQVSASLGLGLSGLGKGEQGITVLGMLVCFDHKAGGLGGWGLGPPELQSGARCSAQVGTLGLWRGCWALGGCSPDPGL